MNSNFLIYKIKIKYNQIKWIDKLDFLILNLKINKKITNFNLFKKTKKLVIIQYNINLLKLRMKAKKNLH